MPRPTAIDLFSGAGGLSLGLEAAGFDVLLASDLNPAASRTYQRNFPNHRFMGRDVRDLTPERIKRATGLRRGELDLLIGGPPCQGFSIIGPRKVQDERNVLFREFVRIGQALQPRAIVMENVPGLATLARGAALDAILESLWDAGYRTSFAELLAAQYGVPQMRWRMVFVAFRRDLGIPPGFGFPAPTHGPRGIGALIPNCTISAEDMAGFLTVRDAIGDLPPVGAGECVDAYAGPPTLPYQREMRRGAGRRLSNHYAPRLSALNLERIALLEEGQNWRDLPRHVLPESMRRALRKDHTRRYSRMRWVGVPRAIITRFRDPKSGEYIHPSQQRTISIREAARIQSFRDAFVFEGSYSEQYDQVGNAVPAKMAEAVVREVLRCLHGTATHHLSIAEAFARRPSVRQASFAFDALQEERAISAGDAR